MKCLHFLFGNFYSLYPVNLFRRSMVLILTFILMASGSSVEANHVDPDLLGVTTAQMNGPCGEPDWNNPVTKATITGTYSLPGNGGNTGTLVTLLDSDNATQVQTKNNSLSSVEAFVFQFPQATILTGIEFGINTGTQPLRATTNIEVQASTDGVTYTPISGTFSYGTNLSAAPPQYGATTANAYTFPFSNTTAYTYYRLYATDLRTNFSGEFTDIYFDYTSFDAQLSNQGCADNGTSEDYSDDLLTFDLNPIPGVVGTTYSVAIDGGYTISPTTGTYGQVTSFTVSSGSSGGGDLTVTLSDASVPCDQDVLISNTVNGCLPGPCGEPDWNDSALKATLTGDFHIPGTGATDGPLAILVDSDNESGVGTKSNSYTNTAAFTVNFPQATVLYGMEVVVNASGTEPITGGVMRVEGSNDGVTYTAVSEDFTHGTNLVLGAAQYGTGVQAYTFPFPTNTVAYQHYRLYAVSMNTRFGRSFDELYFDYDFFDAQLTNQGCTDNGTFSDYTDDLLTFDLNPIPGVAGNTYEVLIGGDYTISPTTGTYGQVTSFTVSSGSSGSGDLGLTIVDSNTPCAQVVIIPNTTNACIPGPCGGPDWNLVAEKSSLTGDYHVPGNGCECGPLAVMVDGDITTGHGTKSNNYTNTAAFTVNFGEPTLLYGMEVVVNATNSEPITGGVMRVEGSNDGINYTPVSIDFTHGTNLSVSPAQYGTGAQAYTFPFPDNTDTYTYYRLFATSMSTRFGRRFNELYFQYDVFDSGVNNVSVGDNGTPGVFTDDLLVFELNPQPGIGSYTVQSSDGWTVIPATGIYGQSTSFQLSAGSAGTGDVTLLLVDENVPCVQEFVIPNPDLTAIVASSQAACASPSDNPLGTITLTAPDDVFTKAEYNIGTIYAGSGYATASDITNSSTGFTVTNTLPNPIYTSYYTVRAYASETLYRDFVVSLEPKACSVADLVVSISPATDAANEGEQLTYIVTLTNAGPDPALNVDVKVDIPTGLDLLTASSSIGDYSPSTQLWTADLVPLGSHQLTVTYRMK